MRIFFAMLKIAKNYVRNTMNMPIGEIAIPYWTVLGVRSGLVKHPIIVCQTWLYSLKLYTSDSLIS